MLNFFTHCMSLLIFVTQRVFMLLPKRKLGGRYEDSAQAFLQGTLKTNFGRKIQTFAKRRAMRCLPKSPLRKFAWYFNQCTAALQKNRPVENGHIDTAFNVVIKDIGDILSKKKI